MISFDNLQQFNNTNAIAIVTGSFIAYLRINTAQQINDKMYKKYLVGMPCFGNKSKDNVSKDNSLVNNHATIP